MHFLRRLFTISALTLAGFACLVHAAWAEAPHNWQMWHQPAASPVQADIASLHVMVMWIITVITVFVAGLLVFVAWRFSAARNPTPSQTSHNTMLEIAWTVIPVLILVVIAIPSFRLIYFQDRTQNADMTIKVTGHQWYWEYSYPDHGNVTFNSRMIPEQLLKPGQLRMLEVDEQVVVPVGKNIRILTTSADVIHSFYIPAVGVQRYAIPGRLIETWVRIDRPGVFYGQCNQICGTQHSGMPIAIRAVPPAEFDAWTVQAKTKYASDDGTPIKIATAP